MNYTDKSQQQDVDDNDSAKESKRKCYIDIGDSDFKAGKLEESDVNIGFNSSELGTKEYWDGAYKQELVNFNHSGDIGDIWFGEESITRVIKWLKSSEISKESSILDIGCGNGITLSYLADEGFKNLFGVDYSEDAIRLSRSVAAKRNTPITFEEANIVGSNSCSELLRRKYDVCHDKGTFDAVCLSPDNPESEMNSYIQNVYKILNPRGLFILTSCNWTEEELLSLFDKYFEKIFTIPTPMFRFGGKTGTTVTSLVLRKRH